MMAEVELTNEMKARITDKVLRVLFSNHTSHEKRKPHETRERLNFACPYCGDSTESDRKKRGNIYWNDLYYHCYNCGAHAPVNSFLRDFDVELDDEDRIDVINYIREHRKTFVSTGTLSFHLFDKIEELALDRDTIMNGFNAFPINERTYRAYPYLKSRLLHQKLRQFAYDPRRKQLYIFNLSNSGKVIGLQVRELQEGRGPKYKTWNLQRIYDRLNLDHGLGEEELDQINKISMLFGILQIDMSRDFTIFEGPIDAMFMRNSVGITGVKKQVVEWDDIPTARYFFDNDRDGKAKMIEKLKKGQRVFMWEKFLSDYNIPSKKVKDLNDLIKYEYMHKKNSLANLDQYFTADSLDIVFL